MKVYAIKVKKEHAEKKRKELIKKSLLAEFEVKRDEKYVYFPVKRKIKGCVLIETKKRKKKIEINYPFEVIGDIAILEIKDASKKEKKMVAKKIMKLHRNLKSVYAKAGGIKGIYRIRKLEFLAGEKNTETTHKETGCLFKLDVAKVYFSPRLQYERERIAKQIKDGETIFVPFAGVGPFPIIISKLNEKKKIKIYVNELNPIAFKYLKENIKLNKVKNIIPIYGDARKLKKKEFKETADRIVMPIPMSSENFLDIPFFLAKKNCIVHFYHFSERIEDTKKLIENYAKKAKRKIKIIFSREVRSYSKNMKEFVVDFVIT